MTGSLTLKDYPGGAVIIACDKCGRTGRYRKQTLIKKYGADIPLPDLLREIARCERAGQMHDACGIRFPALK